MTQGVIFDVDGVLVASEAAHQASWRALGRNHGVQMDDATFTNLFGRTSRDIIRAIWGEHLSDEQVGRLDDEKETVYRDLIRGLVPLTIGARETLAALRQAGLTLAVATSGPPANLDLVLDETGLRPLFAATVHGFDVKHGKPAPDVFLLAARRAGLAPRHCVVVEDAPAGIAAALAAEMKVVGLAGTHPARRLQAAGAHRVVERLTEISPELVADLLTS